MVAFDHKIMKIKLPGYLLNVSFEFCRVLRRISSRPGIIKFAHCLLKNNYTSSLLSGAGNTGDILTLNGPLTAGDSSMYIRNITLSAGNEIIKNSTITVRPLGSYPAGTLTEYANMNGPAPPPTCYGGQYWDGTACVCPTGQQLVGYACQPITCPTGQRLVGNFCEPIICPTGQRLIGNLCEPITCPTGQRLVGNLCEPIICPTGQQLVGSLCEPIICTGGQQLVGSLCICPGGQVFIGAGCQCPAGTIDYAGACKTPSIVPGTDTTTVVYFPGAQEMRLPLLVTMQSSLNTVDPSLPATTSPVALQTLSYPSTDEKPAVGAASTTGQGKDDNKGKGTGTVSVSVSGSPGGGAGDDLKPKKNYCN